MSNHKVELIYIGKGKKTITIYSELLPDYLFCNDLYFRRDHNYTPYSRLVKYYHCKKPVFLDITDPVFDDWQ